MMGKSYVFIIWLSAALSPYPAEGLVGAADQSPLDVIRARNEAVASILESAGDEELSVETKEELKDIINGFVDFRELSRRALGKYWQERTEQERADFVNVFRQLIRNSSVKKLEVYKADRVEYQDPEIDGSAATVTTIAYKGQKSVEIVYDMHRVSDEWKAYDIVIDGASTVRTYRDSFYRQIAKTSYGEMYATLVRRLEEGT